MPSRKPPGKDTTAKDMFAMNPYEIVIEGARRGRTYEPTEQQVMEMAVKLYKEGQIHPVIVRPAPNDTAQLVLGFRRTAAARMLRDGFSFQAEGEDAPTFYHRPDFRIECKLGKLNDLDALIKNTSENIDALPLSIIDHAHNQREFRDQHGWNDKMIAAHYHWTVAEVRAAEDLLLLSKAHQDLVHFKKMSLEMARGILQLSEADRNAAVETALGEDGRVSSQQVRKFLRQHHLSDDAKMAGAKALIDEAEAEEESGEPTSSGQQHVAYADAAPKGGGTGVKTRPATAAPPKADRVVARTYGELKQTLSMKALLDHPMASLAKLLQEFSKGTITDDAFSEAWDSFSTVPVEED